MAVQLDFLLLLFLKQSIGYSLSHLVLHRFRSVLIVQNIIILHLLTNSLQNLSKDQLLQHCFYLLDSEFIWFLTAFYSILPYQRKPETKFMILIDDYQCFLLCTFVLFDKIGNNVTSTLVHHDCLIDTFFLNCNQLVGTALWYYLTKLTIFETNLISLV